MSFEVFAFLGVMYGVILSLGIAALLAAMGGFLQQWSTHRPYWVYASWVSLQLVLYLHVWWSVWSLQRAVADWTFPMFLALLLGPAALFLSTQVLLFEPGSATNSREHYFRIHRVFFSLIAVVVGWEIVAAPLFFDAVDPLIGLQLLVIAVLVVLAVSKSPRVHAWLAGTSWLLFLISLWRTDSSLLS